jgi:SAM-dependent methyltransferase
MEHNLLSTKDADGYGILDAADKRGHKNAYIDYLQKLALDREGAFKFTDIVLDFGCGVGRFCPWLASRCSQVYGIDTGTEVLRLAVEYNARPNIVYQVYDGETLPFPQSYFNAILCVFGGVLQKHVFPEEQLTHLVGELQRVLKAPGIILAIEHVYGRTPAGHYPREELLAHFAQHGLVCTSHYPIRKGHWPILYMIRLGLIPTSLFPRLAQYELDKRRYEREAYLDYKDYLFRFEKKG